MKNLIIHEFSFRELSSRRVLPAFRQFVPPPTWLCLLLLALWVPSGACAATYYIDYASGADTNEGTSIASAWKHCPGDSAATGTPANTTLNAGDTVHFKGGVVYSTSGIVINHSGTLGNAITYDGTGNNWGAGNAVIDGGYLLNCQAITLNSGISYIAIAGFEIRNCGGYADDDPVVLNAAAGVYGNTGTNALMRTRRSGGGVDMSKGNNTNICLANLLIHRMGTWHTTYGWDGASVDGGGIWVVSPQSLIITNCEITRCGNSGIGLYGISDVNNVLVTDCYIHKQIAWGIDIAPQASGITFSNIVITKTRILDMNDMGGDWTGTANDTRNHMNYIFLRQSGTACYWTNVFITRCWFGETNSSPGGGGGTGGIFLSEGPSVNIYNNIFCQAWATAAISIQWPTLSGMNQVVRIYNNTFQRGSGPEIMSSLQTTDQRQLYVENNVFVDSPGSLANAVMIATDGGWTKPKVMNHNIYYAPDWTVAQKYVANLDYSDYFSQLAAREGYETNGLYANPLFVDATNTANTLRNFQLAANSPAIGAGTNLSAYFMTDYAGTARPANGSWTIGALQASSGKFPAAPTVMLFFPGPAIINKGQSATLNWKCVGATNLNISGIGDVPLQGSTNVSPASTTTYTATALGVGTVKVASITLAVE